MSKKIKDERTKISLKGKFGLENYFIPIWYLGIVAVTFVLSLYSIGFDMTKLATSDYWGGLAINYCLAIVSLMASTTDGRSKGKKKDSYRKAIESLQQTIHEVHTRGISFLLPNYLSDKYERDKKSFIHETLTMNAIDPDFFNLTTREIKKRRKELDLSNDQVSVLLKLKKGKIRVRQISTSDLLSEKSADSKTSLGPSYSSGKRQLDLALPRLVMMLVISALFASIGFDKGTNQSIESTFLNLAFRLFTIVTSIAAGYMNGFTIDSELEVVFSKREDILRIFLQKIDTGEYVPELGEGVKLPANNIEAPNEAVIDSPGESEDDEYEIIEVTPEEAEKLIKKNNE